MTSSTSKLVEGQNGYDLGITREWLPLSTKTSPLPLVIRAFGEMFDPLANKPLSKRSWCLQERLLSRRTFYYASSQTFWECAYCIRSEDGCFFLCIAFDGSASIKGVGKLKRQAFRNTMLYVYKRVETPLLLSGFEGIIWTELVAEYSQRNLLYEEDKLSAIAGLAYENSVKTNDTYFAGLWHGSLGLHLCWRVYMREEIFEAACEGHSQGQRYGKTLSALRIPDTYCAPSWSWASIDVGVTLAHFNIEERHFSNLYGEVKREGIGLFGRVKEGYIQLPVQHNFTNPSHMLSRLIIPPGSPYWHSL